MLNKAILHARILDARRAHDAAIRALDSGWEKALAELHASPKADHAAILQQAEARLRHVLVIPGQQPYPNRRTRAR